MPPLVSTSLFLVANGNPKEQKRRASDACSNEKKRQIVIDKASTAEKQEQRQLGWTWIF